MNHYQRIKDLREDADLTQEEIAHRLGTTKQQISKYETGLQMMPITRYIELAITYSVSLDYLAGLVDEKESVQDIHRTISSSEYQIIEQFRKQPKHIKEAILKLLKLKEK